MRLLVVEDEPELAATLRKALVEEGFAVDVAVGGEETLWQAEAVPDDVIVLDLMIPCVDEWEVVRRLRARGGRVPVLVLTARDATADKVRGLDEGADDYLTKPFTFAELFARIRARIRRAAGSPAPVLDLGDVRIETSARRVMRAGVDVKLAAKEYALLEFMALHRGTLVTRSKLYEQIYWDSEDTMPNAVDVYVASLRKEAWARSDQDQPRRGIDPTDLPRIFERFCRAGKARSPRRAAPAWGWLSANRSWRAMVVRSARAAGEGLASLWSCRWPLALTIQRRWLC